MKTLCFKITHSTYLRGPRLEISFPMQEEQVHVCVGILQPQKITSARSLSLFHLPLGGWAPPVLKGGHQQNGKMGRLDKSQPLGRR